jgi:hypothetical protein
LKRNRGEFKSVNLFFLRGIFFSKPLFFSSKRGARQQPGVSVYRFNENKFSQETDLLFIAICNKSSRSELHIAMNIFYSVENTAVETEMTRRKSTPACLFDNIFLQVCIYSA